MKQPGKKLLDLEDNNEIYTALKSMPNAPKNIILPICLSSVLYQESNAELNIIDFPDQIYGKAVHGEKVRLQFKNGNVYEGDVLNGMLHGTGRLEWTDGVIYTGEFQFNRITGEGVYNWPDGSEYSGQVQDSLRHGFGVFKQNGVIYEGEWCKGYRHGKGVLKHPSGSVYTGEFQNGRKHGKGKMDYPNGNKFDGLWQNDQKNGLGTMYWVTRGEKYSGCWGNNLQNGFGTHLWLEERGEGRFLRNRYEGYWSNGFREGFGVFYYANGTKYEGEWQVNLKEGFARFTEETGEVKFCQFVNDKNPQQQALILETTALMMGNSLQMDSSAIEAEDSKTRENLNKEENNITGEKSLLIEIGEGSLPKLEMNPPPDSPLKSPRNQTSLNNDNSPKSPRKLNSPRKRKDQESPGKQAKKPVIDANPFYKMLDFSDIFTEFNEPFVTTLMKNVTNMLLRHNPSLRKVYKHYAGIRMSSDEQLFENELHFALTSQKFWKLLRDIRIMTPKVSLATINRLTFQGKKAGFEMTMDENLLIKKLELLKNNENLRVFNDEELMIWNYANQTLTVPATDDSSKPLPKLSIHSPGKVLLYRHFVESLTRTAFLRCEDPKELHRTLEKIIVGKVVPIFELKSKKTKDSSTMDAFNNYSGIFENIRSEIHSIFRNELVKKQSGIFTVKDETVLVKSLFKILSESKLIHSDDDKWVFMQIVEKSYDQEESLSSLLNESLNNTSSEKANKRKEKEVQSLKAKRMSSLVENELIFEEFEEILRVFLMKKKDHHCKSEGDVLKYFTKSLAVLKKACRKERKEVRFWPESEKDRQLAKLKREKEELRRIEEKRRRDAEQKKREDLEMKMMALEDKNIVEEKELEEAAGEGDSEANDNGSEGSYF